MTFCYIKVSKGQKNEWFKSIQENIKSWHENHIYDLVKLLKSKRAWKNKWVYMLKIKSNSQVKYKAKLVVEEFSP